MTVEANSTEFSAVYVNKFATAKVNLPSFNVNLIT